MTDVPIISEEQPKTCMKCIFLNLYAGSGTGECSQHPEKGWIGSLSPSCEDHWPVTNICLTCKHWEKQRQSHFGICKAVENRVWKCDSFCSKWEERPDVKEYLQRIVDGDEE